MTFRREESTRCSQGWLNWTGRSGKLHKGNDGFGRDKRGKISRTKQLNWYLGYRSGRSLGGLPCFRLDKLVSSGTNNQDIGDTGQPGWERAGGSSPEPQNQKLFFLQSLVASGCQGKWALGILLG